MITVEVVKQVGLFQLCRIGSLHGFWTIRVSSPSQTAPVCVELYSVSGNRAEESARRLFDQFTTAWEKAVERSI